MEALRQTVIRKCRKLATSERQKRITQIISLGLSGMTSARFQPMRLFSSSPFSKLSPSTAKDRPKQPAAIAFSK